MEPQWLTEFRSAAGELPLVVTLATVDRDGSPHARSVAIRHIAPDGSLWFTADARSDKVAQLAGRNEAEIVGWIPQALMQFRFFGTVDALGPAATLGLRLRLWQGLSDDMRATFLWPAPGEPREPDSAFALSADEQTPIPETFEVLFIEPTQVEQLFIGMHPHTRLRWRADQAWAREELNP